MILTGYGLTYEYKRTKQSKWKTIFKVKREMKWQSIDFRFLVQSLISQREEKKQTDNFLYLCQIPGVTDIL